MSLEDDAVYRQFLGKLPKHAESMTLHEKMELLQLLEEHEKRLNYSGTGKWYIPGTPYSIDNLPKHKAFFDAGSKYRIRLVIGGNRCLAEGTLIATPKGPVPIEELQIGDEVYDRNGNPTRVLEVYDNGEQEVFEVVSRGKLMLECTPNHELDCRVLASKKRPWADGTVEEKRVRADELGKLTAVRRSYAKASLGTVHEPHAYVIGAMLGDGCCTCGTKTKVAISSANAAIPERVAGILQVPYSKNGGSNYTYMIHAPTFNHYDQWMKGKKAHEKGVDLNVIKTWDRESLLQFVAGLIDTDGSLSKGKDGHSLTLTMQAYPVHEAFQYACTALWMDTPVISVTGGKHYVNGPCYISHIRNPWKVKLACDELRPYLVHKYKSELDYSVFGGKRSFPDQVKLTMTNKSRVCRTYDIKVQHEDHFYLLANGLSVSNCGKSELTAYEASVHATGNYPDWWTGRRFDAPTNLWVVGDTNQTVKDILQVKLLGNPGARGTGMLPLKTILNTTAKAGVSGAIASIQVRHASGGVSNIGLLSYQQGVEAFYGTSMSGVLLDEEPPQVIYNECVIRTATTGGFVTLSFTPLKGYTPLIVSLFQHADLLCGAKPLEGGDILFDKSLKKPEQAHRAIVQLGWSDSPWLDERTKEELLAETPPALRAPRSQGIPTYGAGSAFPIERDKITFQPGEVALQDSWKRIYGLDVGWDTTSAIWAAHDTVNDIVYIYDEYYGHEALPDYHAYNIRSRGDWIPGAIDPSAGQSGQDDGRKLIDQYRRAGLKVQKANNSRKSGYAEMWQRMVLGKLKISTMCKTLLSEITIAQVDEKGALAANHKLHGLDAFRYALMSVEHGKVKPAATDEHDANTRGYISF